MTASNTTTAASTDGLHPRIAELLAELDASRAELRALIASLPPDTLTTPPSEFEWSIAQILEHLAMVEDGSGRFFSRMMKDAEASGERESEQSSVLGLNDSHQIVTANVRFMAPEFIRPTAGLSPDESLARLDASRARLKEAMRRASGLALGKVSMPHPAFGPFTAYQWLLATSQHERRHMRQIRRIAGLRDG
jgi:hypothetical protein